MKAWRAVGLLCVPCLFLAGCAGSDNNADGASARNGKGASGVHDVIELDSDDGARASSLSDRYSGPVPDFSGPHAEDFVRAYRGTTTDLQRRILDDEKITEQEREELKSVFESCNFSTHNQKVVWGRKDLYSYIYLEAEPKDWSEGFESLSREERLKITEDRWRTDPCDPLTVSDILDLYWRLRANPENQDFPTIIAACLVRKGLRPKGYTAEDYKNESGDISLGDPFWSCHDDPLGLLGDDIKP